MLYKWDFSFISIELLCKLRIVILLIILMGFVLSTVWLHLKETIGLFIDHIYF